MTSRLHSRWAVLLAPTVAFALLLGTPHAAAASSAEVYEALERGHWHTAAELLGPALVAASPLDPEAHLLLARARYLIGDHDGARGWLGTADALVGTPLPGGHLHLAGLLRADAGDPGAAVPLLRSAFARSPEYALALDWGRVAWQAGEWEEALAAFLAAAATPAGAQSPWPALNVGRLLLLLGRPAEAVTALERSLDIYDATDPGGPLPPGPVYAEAWFRLGEAREALGARPEAEAAYRAAQSVDPQHAGARSALARLEVP